MFFYLYVFAFDLGATKREEQFDCSTGPKQQMPDPAWGGEEENWAAPQMYTWVIRWP